MANGDMGNMMGAGAGAGAGGTSPDTAAPEQETEQPHLVIEISCMDDGTYKIERETGEQEAAEMSGGGEAAGDQSPVTVNSKEEVLEVVRHILDAEKGSPEEQAEAAKAQQRAGYEGA